jgi:endoribonuclease L-PSP, putative
MGSQSVVSTNKAPAAAGPYSQARWCGQTLYLSGQIGLNPAGGGLAGDSTAEQARQALDNLGAVLEAAGLGWADLVKVTIFLADMADFAEINQIYASYFQGCSALPARACVQVAALPLGARFEIEGIACKGD